MSQEDAATPVAVLPQAAVPQGAVPQAGVPQAAFPGFPATTAPAASAGRANGMVVAAAVLQLIQAALGAIAGLWLLAAAQSDVGGLVDDLSGGALTGIGLALTAISAAVIVVSVQCLRGRRGAWVATVVLQSLALAMWLLGLAGSAGDGGAGGAVLPLLYTGVTLGLAIVGGRRQFSGAAG